MHRRQGMDHDAILLAPAEGPYRSARLRFSLQPTNRISTAEELTQQSIRHDLTK
jgi:hypothetical protein